MPTRLDLARWIAHIIKHQLSQCRGPPDHEVSEAIYLDDPEGNGVEVYCDRPRSAWRWQEGMVAMVTEALNVDAILQELDETTPPYERAPEGLRIGHIHLHVGDVDKAEDFYGGILGLDVVRRRGWRDFHVVGRLSSSCRRQHLALAGHQFARSRTRRPVLVRVRSRDEPALDDALVARLEQRASPQAAARRGRNLPIRGAQG